MSSHGASDGPVVGNKETDVIPRRTRRPNEEDGIRLASGTFR